MTKFSCLSFLCLAAVAASSILGCDESKSTQETRAPRTDQFLVQSFTLKGTTPSPSQVTVQGQPDADGAIDTTWQAELKLDGSEGPGSLPKDNGYTQTYTATIEAKAQDGKTTTKKVTITFHE